MPHHSATQQQAQLGHHALMNRGVPASPAPPHFRSSPRGASNTNMIPPHHPGMSPHHPHSSVSPHSMHSSMSPHLTPPVGHSPYNRHRRSLSGHSSKHSPYTPGIRLASVSSSSTISSWRGASSKAGRRIHRLSASKRTLDSTHDNSNNRSDAEDASEKTSSERSQSFDSPQEIAASVLLLAKSCGPRIEPKAQEAVSSLATESAARDAIGGLVMMSEASSSCSLSASEGGGAHDNDATVSSARKKHKTEHNSDASSPHHVSPVSSHSGTVNSTKDVESVGTPKGQKAGDGSATDTTVATSDETVTPQSNPSLSSPSGLAVDVTHHNSAGSKSTSRASSFEMETSQSPGHRRESTSSMLSQVVIPHFPTVLHMVLTESEFAGSVLQWLAHGKAWKIVRWDALRRKVLPKYFSRLQQQSKSASAACSIDEFLCHLEAWGFEEVTDGPDAGAYTHVLFRRGLPKLSQDMRFSPTTKEDAPDDDGPAAPGAAAVMRRSNSGESSSTKGKSERRSILQVPSLASNATADSHHTDKAANSKISHPHHRHHHPFHQQAVVSPEEERRTRRPGVVGGSFASSISGDHMSVGGYSPQFSFHAAAAAGGMWQQRQHLNAPDSSLFMRYRPDESVTGSGVISKSPSTASISSKSPSHAPRRIQSSRGGRVATAISRKGMTTSGGTKGAATTSPRTKTSLSLISSAASKDKSSFPVSNRGKGRGSATRRPNIPNADVSATVWPSKPAIKPTSPGPSDTPAEDTKSVSSSQELKSDVAPTNQESQSTAVPEQNLPESEKSPTTDDTATSDTVSSVENTPEIRAEKSPTTDHIASSVENTPEIRAEKSPTTDDTASSVENTAEVRAEKTPTTDDTTSSVENTAEVRAEKTPTTDDTTSSVENSLEVTAEQPPTTDDTVSYVENTLEVTAEQSPTTDDTVSYVENTLEVRAEQSPTTDDTVSYVENTPEVSAEQPPTTDETASNVENTPEVRAEQSPTTHDTASPVENSPVEVRAEQSPTTHDTANPVENSPVEVGAEQSPTTHDTASPVENSPVEARV